MTTTSIELTRPAQAHAITTNQDAFAASIAPSIAPSNPFSALEDETLSQQEDLSRTRTIIESRGRTLVTIASITLATGMSSMLNGLTTVVLPTLQTELGLSDSVSLWPSSIQALTCGCTLLLSGSLADALGARFMYLTGAFLQTGFVLGCALSRNGTEIILFRALSGVAISFSLPSATSIITSSFTGTRRNMAFACMGGGQPVGFAIGLTLGGVLTDAVSWRLGYYIGAAVSAIIFVGAIWGLPPSADSTGGMSWKQKVNQVRFEIDWIGAIIISSALAMLSYVFATITGSTSDISQPSSVAPLSLAFALIPVFILWIDRQERLGRPAIIPNTIWHNKIFTTICIAVFMTWGAFNAIETMLTFYFQNAQRLNATQTSLRFLPAPVSGVAANIVIGTIVAKYRANYLVVITSLVSSMAPFVMTFAKPTSSYWSAGFLANLLNPVGADGLYTISNLLITSVFPSKTQGLAGGVFNTVSQIGKSVGLALVAVIASSITAKSDYSNKTSPDALMMGYNATFWFCFALSLVTPLVSLWGLRNIGKVGHKRD